MKTSIHPSLCYPSSQGTWYLPRLSNLVARGAERGRDNPSLTFLTVEPSSPPLARPASSCLGRIAYYLTLTSVRWSRLVNPYPSSGTLLYTGQDVPARNLSRIGASGAICLLTPSLRWQVLYGVSSRAWVFGRQQGRQALHLYERG